MEGAKPSGYNRVPSNSYELPPIQHDSVQKLPPVAQHQPTRDEIFSEAESPQDRNGECQGEPGNRIQSPFSLTETLHEVRPTSITMDSYGSTLSGATEYKNDNRGSAASGAHLLGVYADPQDSTFIYEPGLYEAHPAPVQSKRFGWWNPGWLMYGFYIVGVAGALSHHFFYATLAGQEARDQVQMLRYGAALAYVTKAGLVASVALAYRQQIWATLRRKTMSIAAIDGLFAAMEDIGSMFTIEAFREAKIAMFLAALFWLFPLTVILAPATLTVEPTLVLSETVCSSVRTLNFGPEAENNWRNPTRFNGLPELSVSIWNATSSNPSDPNRFDYYTAPSPPAQQVATMSAYLKRIVTMENISMETCGSGWNCSYTISFIGPGYNCIEQNGESGLPDPGRPFDKSILLPSGNLSYVAHVTLGDYSPVQVNSSTGGIPVNGPPFPEHLGVFRTEPVLWIGYADVADRDKPLPLNSSMPSWSSTFSPRLFSCEHYITNYTVVFNFTSGVQQTMIKSRKFIEPVIDTKLQPGVDANDGTQDNTTAIPNSHYVYPRDVKNYRLTAAFHSLGALMRNFINGTIDMANGVDAPIANTEALKTRLIDPRTYLAVPNLMDQIQSFYEDIILSLLSNPQFLSVAWASDPTKLSSVGKANGTEGNYPCTRSRVMNAFVYHSRELWLVYGTAILLATVSTALGAAAIAQNSGVVRNTRFSSIVAATRSKELDSIGWRQRGANSWGEVPREVARTRLGYGLVSGGLNEKKEEVMDYGFGVEGKVRQGFGVDGKRASVLSFQRLDT